MILLKERNLIDIEYQASSTPKEAEFVPLYRAGNAQNISFLINKDKEARHEKVLSRMAGFYGSQKTQACKLPAHRQEQESCE